MFHFKKIFKKITSFFVLGTFMFLFAFHNLEIFAATPTLQTNSATSITKTEATLNGEVIDNGGEALTEFGFEYGLSTSYGSSIQVNNFNYVLDEAFGSISYSGSFGFGLLSMAADSLGNLYILNKTDNNVQKFDSSGNYVSQFGTAGTGDGEFSSPYGIAVDSLDNIYVTDSGNNRIQKFNSAGVYQSQFGTAGSGDGEFNQPSDIAIDSSGNIYVTDYGNNRIQKFNSAGV